MKPVHAWLPITLLMQAPLRIIAVDKVVLVSLATAALLWARFDEDAFRRAYAQWPPSSVPSLASRFAAWDAAHYLVLSEKGYERGSHSCAFYPLWPAVIRVGARLTFGSPLAAGLLLANGLSCVALMMFYRIVEGRYGAAIARDALILLLAFPGAIFFAFPYNEALYLTMVLLFFDQLDRDAYFWPCVVAFLMPLTKAIGIFILLPFAWHLYERRKRWYYWLLLLTPVLGYATYFGSMYAWTGNAAEGFEAQVAFVNSPSIHNMFDIPNLFHASLNLGSVVGMLDSLLDRGLFVLLLVLAPLMYRLNTAWFLYAIIAGSVPAMTSYFMSYRRYFIVCFPVFIVLAQLLRKTKRRWLFWYYVALLGALQAWAVKDFLCFKWAG